MVITGQYLYNYFKNKTGAPYTSYLSPAVWNKLIEEAVFQAIDERFVLDQSQKWKDELSGFINTNVLVTNIGKNSLNLRPIAITSFSNVGTLWILQTNIPFARQNTPALIQIQGVTGFTNNPNGVFNVTSFSDSVLGTIEVHFTAPDPVGGTYVANSGYFSFQNTGNLVANQLVDYLHLLNVKCKFTKPQNHISVVSSTGGTPVVVQLNWYNNFRTSSLKNNVMVTMSGWVNNTSANGSFFIKVINDLRFELYSDIYLQNPVVGIVNETNNNIILGLTYYNSANKYLSTQKSNTLSQPSWDNPGFELQGNRLNLYPMNIVNGSITTPCTEVTIDYVCNPKLPYVLPATAYMYSGLYIDANDTAFDLSTIAPEKFWLSVSDKAALIYTGTSRDSELNQITDQQIQQNP